MFSESGKLVLFERKGIQTDLFAIEKYVDQLSDEIDKNRRDQFLKESFSPIQKDP